MSGRDRFPAPPAEPLTDVPAPAPFPGDQIQPPIRPADQVRPVQPVRPGDQIPQVQPVRPEWLPPQVIRPPSDAFLPPGVPGLFDRLPPSRWIDMQGVDQLDQFGNLVRQFNDGNRMVIQGNPPNRILVSNAVITKDLRLDVNGRIIDAYQVNNITGVTQRRPDCFGAIVDGYGAMHGVNGRVERRNGLISPNEQAYVHGLIYGFPERWAFLPQQRNNQFIPRPYYQRPYYQHHHHQNHHHQQRYPQQRFHR